MKVPRVADAVEVLALALNMKSLRIIAMPQNHVDRTGRQGRGSLGRQAQPRQRSIAPGERYLESGLTRGEGLFVRLDHVNGGRGLLAAGEPQAERECRWKGSQRVPAGVFYSFGSPYPTPLPVVVKPEMNAVRKYAIYLLRAQGVCDVCADVADRACV